MIALGAALVATIGIVIYTQTRTVPPIASTPLTPGQKGENPKDGLTYSIAPASQAIGASGGSASVSVTAGADRYWAATSNVTWITISSGASGTGNGTVNYTVAANTSTSQRSGTLTVGGQTATVTQAGATPLARSSYGSTLGKIHTRESLSHL